MYEIVEIPYRDISVEALDNLIEDFISRDGTDYGEFEVSLADKKAQIMSQLQQGKVAIIYDEASESCTLLPRDQLSTHYS